MCQTWPLPDTHPELSILEWPGFREYRVENWRLARDGSARIIRRTSPSVWLLDVCLPPLLLALLWTKLRENTMRLLLAGLVLALFVRSRCTQVLYESVLVFPTLGIQLETHRGHPSLQPLLVSRRFIHVGCLENVVIHEGLHRWNVRYFLAAIKRSNNGTLSIHVAFENILPYFPVLLEVYTGVQNTIYSHD